MSESDDWLSVRILRQDEPAEASYWQRFRIRREPGLNVTGVLQRISANPKTVGGELVAPVAYEANCLEEVCGSCTMLINGRTRQACSALVDKLLADDPGRIELRPMSKFPVIRDLVVNRRRSFGHWRRSRHGFQWTATTTLGRDHGSRSRNSSRRTPSVSA